MPRRIDFINPFGTRVYDDLIRKTLSHYAAEGTELTISHLEGCPADIDYFYSKHLIEAVLFERIMRSEEEGFDAVIVGCCYDPGVRAARELVDIPVVGPMEASMQMAIYHGFYYTIVTDHRKAAPYLEDMAHSSGYGGRCRGVRTVDWFVRDMIKDHEAVARDTIDVCQKVVKETNAETILLGCTIVAACFQEYLMAGNPHPEVSIVNPNLMALKMAEGLADLKQKGGYHISRSGYNQKPSGHFADEFNKARRSFATAMQLDRKS